MALFAHRNVQGCMFVCVVVKCFWMGGCFVTIIKEDCLEWTTPEGILLNVEFTEDKRGNILTTIHCVVVYSFRIESCYLNMCIAFNTIIVNLL